MCTNRNVLLLTKKDKELEYLKTSCKEHNVLITKIYQLCDLIESASNCRYSILFVDSAEFSITEDLLQLFKRKNYYIPYKIILSKEKLNFEDDSVFVVSPDDCNNIKATIDYCIKNNPSQYYLYSDSFLIENINQNLQKLGFTKKYKGFNYLSSIIFKVIANDNSYSSFKKFLYPFVSSLYGVSEASIERDIRNIISKTLESLPKEHKIINELANSKPTTKHIVNILVNEIKTMI